MLININDAILFLVRDGILKKKAQADKNVTFCQRLPYVHES